MQHPAKNHAPPDGMMLDQARLAYEAKLGLWPNKVLTDYLTDNVRRDREKTALISHDGEVISYGLLDARSDTIAANLAALGIGKGDVVSFQLPNWWQFVAIHLACLKIGAISNPLMPIFRARELEYMVKFAGSKVLILPKSFQNFDHEGLGQHLLKTIPSLEHLFVIGGSGLAAFDHALLRVPDNLSLPKTRLSPNDVILLLFTSGTTGPPKGVLHTSNTLLTSANHVAKRLSLKGRDIGFMPAPFAHMIGFNFGMNMAIMQGLPLVMLDRWQPKVALDLITRHKVSYCAGSTPFMVDLADAAKKSPQNHDRFRIFMTAGAPISEAAIKKVTTSLNIQVVPGWGMTEVVQATACQPILTLDRPLTDGAPFAGNEVRIVDQSGTKVAAGQVGNLQFRGSTLFVGYFNRPALYALDCDGWFDTGDLAKMDDEGHIRIAGRAKDILIRGGENIPVFEVENLICQMENVRFAALVGMPDDRLGERGCVFVVLEKGADMTLANLTDFLNQQGLAKHYHPERLEILGEMPRTASGKVQKFILRERARNFLAHED